MENIDEICGLFCPFIKNFTQQLMFGIMSLVRNKNNVQNVLQVVILYTAKFP